MMEPKKIIAGNSAEWAFDHELADGSWLFKYALRGPSVIDFNASAIDGWVGVDLTSDDTSGWVAGLYEWVLFATKGTDRKLINNGFIEIAPDFMALGAGHDPRTHEEKVLASIKSVLEGRVLSDHENYSIDGRSISRIPVLELQKLRRTYALLVYRQKRGSEVIVKAVKTRFANG